jgi:FdrA protein
VWTRIQQKKRKTGKQTGVEGMMVTRNIVRENIYLDSIILMSISNQLRGLENVEEAATIMGTEANKEILSAIGLLTPEGERARPGDMIIAVKTSSEAVVEQVIAEAENLITGRIAGRETGGTGEPRSYGAALQNMPASRLALISIPGEYAAGAAMEVLESGRNVMIFSDNVPLADEIVLKKRARELGLLAMGPDCGTAIINGVALGFANAVRRGPFGIAGASGTGIQEISTLLHKRGYGISHAIGLGGRDLSQEIGGMGMLQAIEALERDPDTEIVILLSKPPAPAVAKRILDRVGKLKKRYVVNFLNGDPEEARKRKLPFAGGLEEAVDLAVAVLKGEKAAAPALDEEFRKRAVEEKKLIGAGKHLRGLFSGGTLADEALVILEDMIGDIHSNVPLRKELALESSWHSVGHTIVDMGEDEFTRGRPHPMIDFSLRCSRLREEAADPLCGAILFDLVLGFGAHEDPAGTMAEALVEARAAAQSKGNHVAFVASITGTEDDPQDYKRQVSMLEEAGVCVLPSNAQAARYAGLLLE